MPEKEEQGLRGMVPPNSLEAEISVLGAMLQDATVVLRAMESLKEDDFYLAEHQAIFKAMASLALDHKPIDLTTVATEMIRQGTLAGSGGMAYLTRLTSSVPTTANAGAYLDIVLEKSTLRKLISACQGISRAAYSQQDSAREILAGAEKAIFDLVLNRTDGETLKPAREVLVNTFQQIEELARQHGEISGVPTGFVDLDSTLTGLHPGELIIIGARPAMGKTSFAMNIASYASIVKGKTVAVFSMEMPREQIMMRVLCGEAKVNMQKVRKGILEDREWNALARALGPISNAPMYLDDTAGLTPSMLRSRCRRLMMDHGLDLVLVDYLGLMRGDGRVESRQLEVAEISRQLKAIALELKVPVVACAQLSRANKDRIDKRPMLSDLRESGSIEQDADVVMFLHREEYYNPDTEDKNIAEVIVSKQRSGPLRTVKLAWLSEITTFANLAREDAPGAPARPGGAGGDAPF
ncbi:MAG: replicative DNA helicase [Clostridia bacterium]|nr:replicative DNA helicase [Clostridia bacterium]